MILKNIFVSVKDEDKDEIFEVVNSLSDNGYNILQLVELMNFYQKKVFLLIWLIK